MESNMNELLQKNWSAIYIYKLAQIVGVQLNNVYICVNPGYHHSGQATKHFQVPQ